MAVQGESYDPMKGELEQKVADILGYFRERLSKSEMNHSEYLQRVQAKLQEYGFWDKNKKAVPAHARDMDFEVDFDAAQEWNIIATLIEEKLDIKKEYGINHDYDLIPGSPISKSAKEDIDVFKIVVKSAKDYLQREIGNREITKKEYDKAVEGYIHSLDDPRYLGVNVPGYRKSTLQGVISAAYEKEFVIKNRNRILEPLEKIGRYPVQDVKEAFKNAL